MFCFPRVNGPLSKSCIKGMGVWVMKEIKKNGVKSRKQRARWKEDDIPIVIQRL